MTLKELRMKKGLSQIELANIIDTDERTIRRIEKENNICSLYVFREYVEYFGSDILDALGLNRKYAEIEDMYAMMKASSVFDKDMLRGIWILDHSNRIYDQIGDYLKKERQKFYEGFLSDHPLSQVREVIWWEALTDIITEYIRLDSSISYKDAEIIYKEVFGFLMGNKQPLKLKLEILNPLVEKIINEKEEQLREDMDYFYK